MALSTSRALSFSSKSGFNTLAVPISASTAVPPRAGRVAVVMGWHAISASTVIAAANSPTAGIPATSSREASLPAMCGHPDVGERANEEGDDQNPGGPVDLALEPPPGPVPATQPVAPTADRSAQARGLGRLHEHAGRQQNGQHDLDDDERVPDSIHGFPLLNQRRQGGRVYPGRNLVPIRLRVVPHSSIPNLDRLPVERVEPRRDVVGSLVLVLEVVSVLPDVNTYDRSQPIHVGAVLVGVALDRELATRIGEQPSPAAAELTHRSLLELLLERVVGAESAGDGVAQPARWRAATVGAHDRPEDRVVRVPAGVVADHAADVIGHGAHPSQQVLD